MALVISNSVGKGGANHEADVIAVKDAFNAIPAELGAPSETLALDGDVTQELIDAIVNFQSFHNLPSVDGLINPNQATHKRINLVLEHLATPSPTATVTPLPASLPMSVGPLTNTVAEPASLPGLASLQKQVVNFQYERRLMHTNESSINWFGVVLPSPLPSDGSLGIPHVFFTPTPIQGGYIDSDYSNFTGWHKLWDDYSSVIGFQLIASGVRQVL
jgi:peptidoglycan hydrolase-like protein with peptidoglycan-binding domain